MNNNDRKRYWYLKLFLVILITCMYCGLVTPSVYAEENEQEAVSQQEPVKNNIVTKPSNVQDKEQKKGLPTLTLTLQDAEGVPISDVDVSVMEGNASGKVRDQAETDKNGKAVFKNLKSGRYYFFANIKSIRKHDGYDFPAIIKEIKTVRSYYISEVNQFDLSENVECTYTIKRNACIWFETFLDVFRSEKIVVVNKPMGIGQNIPVQSVDYIQIYMPMRSNYQIITVKDDDFDSWIIDFYAHDGLRIELL